MIGRKARGTEQDRALIESFLDMMSAERGASPNTLAAYRRDLIEFSAAASRKDASLVSATRGHLKAHLTGLAAAQIAPSTQGRKLPTLSQFYGDLYVEA